MNEHTISLVRESFDLIEPIAPQAGELFYVNLFEADPSLRRLSTGDTSNDGAGLMQVIALLVTRLDQPDLLVPVLRTIGLQLAGLDLRDEHYGTAGAALLKTLYQVLGVAYNAEVEEAWVEVYAALAAKMREAAVIPV